MLPMLPTEFFAEALMQTQDKKKNHKADLL